MPALIEHIISHITALTDLALLNPLHSSPASACARSAMEVGALAAWLAAPENPFAREARWIGYFKTLETFHTKMAADFASSNPRLSRDIKDCISTYTTRMPSERFGRKITPERKPPLKDILTELGYAHVYTAYREVCEIIHGGPETIIRHRRKHQSTDHPMAFTFGLHQADHDWWIAFRIAGWGLAVSAYHSLLSYGFNNNQLQPLLDSHAQLNSRLNVFHKATVA